jgi:hypothetical protein
MFKTYYSVYQENQDSVFFHIGLRLDTYLVSTAVEYRIDPCIYFFFSVSLAAIVWLLGQERSFGAHVLLCRLAASHTAARTIRHTYTHPQSDFSNHPPPTSPLNLSLCVLSFTNSIIFPHNTTTLWFSQH